MSAVAATPERDGTKPVLSLRGITKTFGAVAALTDVDLDVAPAQVVALVGDNGAGKSTLVKVLAGVHMPDAGTITFESEEVTIPSPAVAQRLGIATVYQDLALCENLDVVENLYLGHEIGNRIPGVHLLDESAMEQRTLELLDSLGVTTINNVRIEVAQLSGGQRQAVAIARSLLGEPKLVLLDEPTAALGIVQTREILKLIDRLRDRGLGVVVISHNLVNVFEVADRIVVLRLGRAVASLDADETRREDVVGAITGA